MKKTVQTEVTPEPLAMTVIDENAIAEISANVTEFVNALTVEQKEAFEREIDLQLSNIESATTLKEFETLRDRFDSKEKQNTLQFSALMYKLYKSGEWKKLKMPDKDSLYTNWGKYVENTIGKASSTAYNYINTGVLIKANGRETIFSGFVTVKHVKTIDGKTVTEYIKQPVDFTPSHLAELTNCKQLFELDEKGSIKKNVDGVKIWKKSTVIERAYDSNGKSLGFKEKLDENGNTIECLLIERLLTENVISVSMSTSSLRKALKAYFDKTTNGNEIETASESATETASESATETASESATETASESATETASESATETASTFTISREKLVEIWRALTGDYGNVQELADEINEMLKR